MHLYGDLVLVYGGTGYPFGQDVSNELHVLNLKHLHWKRFQFTNQRSPSVYGAVKSFFFSEFSSEKSLFS